MGALRQTHKNVFKQIFRDGWNDFKRTHPRYEAADEVVQKMLGCGDPANGHAVYLCPDCQARRVVAFSCKSQFCLSCAGSSGLAGQQISIYRIRKTWKSSSRFSTKLAVSRFWCMAL